MSRLLLFLFLAGPLFSQSSLHEQLQAIAADSHGKLYVACSLANTVLNCDLEPHGHPPMQSVFKFPLALTALHLVDQKKLSLDQPVRFLKSDLFVPHAYSPLQDKYPEANVDIPLRELLRLAVTLSDNAAADIIVRLVGGPQVVDDYLHSLGISGFHMEDDEHGLHRDASAQYRNWFEPAAAVQLLRQVNDNSPLSPALNQVLLQWLEDTQTGANRIKGQLPPGTVVFHKTGSSGTDKGLTPATNDIGLITLPDGRRLAIAVFLTDSTGDDAARDAIIARVAKAAYDAALLK
jgi:beta-lactamase class A